MSQPTPKPSDASEQASVSAHLPRGILYLLIGLFGGGGSVYGITALSTPIKADPQAAEIVHAVAKAEADTVRRDCDSKIEALMLRLDGRLARIEDSTSDMKVRLRMVENRMFPTGSLAAPAAAP